MIPEGEGVPRTLDEERWIVTPAGDITVGVCAYSNELVLGRAAPVPRDGSPRRPPLHVRVAAWLTRQGWLR